MRRTIVNLVSAACICAILLSGGCTYLERKRTLEEDNQTIKNIDWNRCLIEKKRQT